jgi:hypothetical protein
MPHKEDEVLARDRPHQGRNTNGRTPYTVFKAVLPKPTRARQKAPKKAA